MQWDGNLVLYSPQGPYWASFSDGHPGARFVSHPTTPVVSIVEWWGGHIWDSQTGVSWVVDSLNAQIRANPEYLDYVIQDVCIDPFDHPTPGDPASCQYHRNIRIGEKLPYQLTDYDKANGARYQTLSSYPVVGSDNSLRIMVSKNGNGGNFGAASWFDFDYHRDGFDLLDTNGGYISAIRTSDGGCFDQTFLGNPGQRNNGWVFFNKDAGSGELNHNIVHQSLSGDRPGNCSAYAAVSDNSVHDVWNPPTWFGFESGKVLSSIITYHFANGDLSRQNNALERYFFTREYGFSRWEAWIPLFRCNAEHPNDANFCHPEWGSNFLRGRCSPGSSVSTWGNQTWVRTDCRDTTFYMDIGTPMIPVDWQQGTQNGVYDVNPGEWLGRMW